MNFPRVEVEWLDSLDVGTEIWMDTAEVLAETCGDSMRSIGYLLKEDERFLWLSQSCHCQENGVVVRVGRPFLIPKACIIEKREVTV